MVFRLLAVLVATASVYLFLYGSDRGRGLPIFPGGIAVIVYASYVAATHWLLLPRLKGVGGLPCAMAAVDAIALSAGLIAVGRIAGVENGLETPLVFFPLLAVAYYAFLYGYGPGLLSALVFGATFLGLTLTTNATDMSQQLALYQLPLFLFLVLLGGYLASRRVGEPLESQAPMPSAESSLLNAQATIEKTPSGSPPWQTARPDLAAGKLRIDGVHGRVYIGNSIVSLSPTETELLYLLAEYAGTPVSQETIRQRVWGKGYQGHGNVVDVTIHRLRRKLERQGHHGYILTVRGKGYVLSAAASGSTYGRV